MRYRHLQGAYVSLILLLTCVFAGTSAVAQDNLPEGEAGSKHFPNGMRTPPAPGAKLHIVSIDLDDVPVLNALTMIFQKAGVKWRITPAAKSACACCRCTVHASDAWLDDLLSVIGPPFQLKDGVYIISLGEMWRSIDLHDVPLRKAVEDTANIAGVNDIYLPECSYYRYDQSIQERPSVGGSDP